MVPPIIILALFWTAWLALFTGQGLSQEKPALIEIEEQAITAIEDLNGTVSREERAPGKPVISVYFPKPIQDKDLTLLKVFRQLKQLHVMEGVITDVGFKHLGQLGQLESLDLTNSSITDAGLKHLAQLTQLKSLDLANTSITDAGQKSWALLTQLKSLDLANTSITDAGLQNLSKLIGLKRLAFIKVPISDTGLAHLQDNTGLRFILLGDTGVTKEGVANLKAALPYALINRYQIEEQDDRGKPGDRLSLFNWALFAFGVLATLVLFWTHWHFTFPRRPWVWKLPLVLGLVLVMGLSLVREGEKSAPLKKGEPLWFWLAVCQVDFGVENPIWMGGYYLPRDDWFIYYAQLVEGQALYQVKESEALALFPTVIQRLQAAPPGALAPDVEKGFKIWIEKDPKRSDSRALMASIREARIGRLKKENPQIFQYILSQEEEFDLRWARCQRYHWNLTVEFLFFTFLILFALWPWLRERGLLRWSLHIGILPILLFIPFWLGYSQFTFTSANYKGGVLYPNVLLMFNGLPLTRWDTAIVERFPKVLEPLSQQSGPMMALTSMGGVGPVAIIVLGLILGCAIFGPGLFMDKLRKNGLQIYLRRP